MLSVKRGRYVGMRRFRVRGQRTPEVNKVALIALKYFNALIAATLIASINALTLTALVFILSYLLSSSDVVDDDDEGISADTVLA